MARLPQSSIEHHRREWLRVSSRKTQPQCGSAQLRRCCNRPETASAMAERGPKATVVEIPNVGHAPTFMRDEQIAIARSFLIG